MTFIEQFEQEFARKLESNHDTSVLVSWACERVLESYRNGITAGQKGATVKRKGESRRRGAFGRADARKNLSGPHLRELLRQDSAYERESKGE